MTTTPALSPVPSASLPPDQDLGPQISRLFSQFQNSRRRDAALRGNPIPDVPAAEEEPALEAFAHWHALRHDYRLQRADLKAMRRTLGLMLRRHRNTFARGEFKPWLRSQRISVSTAYAFINAVINERPGTPKISWRGNKLRLRLKPREFATARHALEKLVASRQPFDLADCILRRLQAKYPHPLPPAKARPAGKAAAAKTRRTDPPLPPPAPAMPPPNGG